MNSVFVARFLLVIAGSFVAAGGGDVKNLPAAESAPIATKPAAASALSNSDWTSIREAYEAGRHAAYVVDGGYRMRNASQRWKTEFNGRGFLVTPDDGDWTWGLELKSYGFIGSEKAVTKPERVTAEGSTVSYHWDANVTEWYKNDRRGLEHGYTVNQRPVNATGLLTIELTVRGGLHPRVQNDGRDVSFMDATKISALNYSGLKVFGTGSLSICNI